MTSPPEPDPDSYPCPAAAAGCDERVERSRFLALAHPLADAARFAPLLEAIRREHHKATHHCHAFRTGHPGRKPLWGAADDGEPAGSAGLPILRAIEGSGLSDVAVVVVRWFGGVKLGTGGLARAYGGAAARALAACPRALHVERLGLELRFPHSLMTLVRRAARRHGALETGLAGGGELELRLEAPASRLEALEEELRGILQGRGDLWRS